MSLEFEWDERKARSNLKKHGVAFDEASTVFGDPLARTIHDPLHSDEEDRFVILANRTGAGLWLLRSRIEEIGFGSSVPARLLGAREKTMKKAASKRSDPDMLDEYDFSQGERGKYAARYAAGTNVVVLAPDVAAVFPDAKSVNEALRALMKIAQKSAHKTYA